MSSNDHEITKLKKPLFDLLYSTKKIWYLADQHFKQRKSRDFQGSYYGHGHQNGTRACKAALLMWVHAFTTSEGSRVHVVVVVVADKIKPTIVCSNAVDVSFPFPSQKLLHLQDSRASVSCSLAFILGSSIFNTSWQGSKNYGEVGSGLDKAK